MDYVSVYHEITGITNTITVAVLSGATETKALDEE
jgi:hypothetical protein